MLPWQPILTGILFRIFPVIVSFLGHNRVPVLVIDYFSFNFGAFLKVLENPEIQDDGSKMATI